MALLRGLAPLCAAANVPLICNDDLAAALAVPGVGLHVGQEDMPPAAARAALGPERPLGLSTHSLAQVRAAFELGGVLNYFAVGPVFATPTKPDYPAVGLELVAAVAALKPRLPWFCIGGIKLANAAQVRAAGARAVVVVSEVLQAAAPEQTTRELRRAMA
jgi:thiamine-phosphate pyrophosphorylase